MWTPTLEAYRVVETSTSPSYPRGRARRLAGPCRAATSRAPQGGYRTRGVPRCLLVQRAALQARAQAGGLAAHTA
jgi:hypothetical protein